MTILYITRKFPPSIGGMQTQSRQFYDSIAASNQVYLISLGRSQAFLPFFIIYAFIRSVAILAVKKPDIIQLGDLVLSPLGFLLKLLFNKPVLSISHGRDSAYTNIIYDFFIIGSAKKLDMIICVSNDIKERLSARGVPKDKATVIPNGIDVSSFKKEQPIKEDSLRVLEAHFTIKLRNKKIILSVSRLVPKKGIKEFIEEVLAEVKEKNKDAIFLIAGDGPEGQKIDNVINKHKFSDSVYRLGRIEHDSSLYKALFAVSDVFVMPNIKVHNDAEGFGIVVLEAAINGVPVVAYDVDGIAEALHNDRNGILIKEGQSGSFAKAICSLLSDINLRQSLAKKAREYVADNFSWDRIKGAYFASYDRLIKESKQIESKCL